MRPQKQKNRHNPAEGLIGDCHRTCYACLLDMERDSIPNFGEVGFDFAKSDEDNRQAFAEACRAWLSEQGYAEFSVGFADRLDAVLSFMATVNPSIYYILVGQSTSGVNHSVIGYGDAIVWDPSLNDSGIVAPCEPDGLFWVTVLVPIGQKGDAVAALRALEDRHD